MDLMSRVLSELDAAIGTAGGALPAGSCAVATPLTNLSAIEPDDPFLLSGMVLQCEPPAASSSTRATTTAGRESGSTAVRRLYRLTPRCMNGLACSSRPPADALESGAPAVLRIFSGFEARVVADGCWWSNAPANTSAAGFWIRAPC